eukprot:PhM_4_TR6666/c0_g1_i1/m.28492
MMVRLAYSTFLLPNRRQHLAEPINLVVERLATSNTLELNRTQLTRAFLIVTDDTRLPCQGTANSVVTARLDQNKILRIAARRAGEIPRLVHNELAGIEALFELLSEPLANVDRVQLQMPEGIDGDFLALGAQFLSNCLSTSALCDENVDAVELIHDFHQPATLNVKINLELGDVHRMHIEGTVVVPQAARRGRHTNAADSAVWRGKVFLEQVRAIRIRRCGCEPAAVTTHHFVDSDHSVTRAVVRDDVPEELGTLRSGGECSETLHNRDNIVVNCLRETDHRELVVVLLQVRRKVCRSRVGVIATDCVQHVDPIFDKTLSGNATWVLTLFDKTTTDAIFDVRKLHARVPQRASTTLVQQLGCITFNASNHKTVTQQESSIATTVSNELDVRSDLRVALNEIAHSAAETWRETAGCQQSNPTNLRMIVHGSDFRHI